MKSGAGKAAKKDVREQDVFFSSEDENKAGYADIANSPHLEKSHAPFSPE